MEFKSKKEVKNYLDKLLYLGMGSQGSCYYRKSKRDVLKIFNDFDESDYTSDRNENEILRFSKIRNKTFIWPTEVITINSKVIGYISPYVKANNLYEINPLSVNLNVLGNSIGKVHDDIKIISRNGIATYDMMYNILYNKSFYVIDEDEYAFSNKDSLVIERENIKNFNYEIYYFLIDNCFNNVVNDDMQLKEIYKYKNEDILLFIKLLKQKLSELSGKEIVYLRDANRYLDNAYGNDNGKYLRKFYKY